MGSISVLLSKFDGFMDAVNYTNRRLITVDTISFCSDPVLLCLFINKVYKSHTQTHT